MEKYCFGVDVGGTTVKVGLFTTDGTIADKWEVKTRTEDGGVFILPDVAESIQEKVLEHKVDKDNIVGIGVGVPGPVTDDGMVHTCVNLGWGEFNVADEVRRLTGIENVKVNNDANVAALGEMWKGGGMGYPNMIMITLGTGVGGGVIYGGKILTGVSGAAGEIGHITVEPNEPIACNCGNHGCLEQFASATGIVKEAKRLLEKTTEESVLRNVQKISAKTVFDAAKNGDKLATIIAEQLGYYLGLVCSHIASVVDPEVFVIGGGVSKAGNILIEVTEKNYNNKVMHNLRGKEFKLATLGNDAGIYGSAKMVISE